MDGEEEITHDASRHGSKIRCRDAARDEENIPGN